MKLLYLTLWNFDKKESDGVAKKILQQVETLKNSGIETDYTYILKNDKSVCANVLGKDKVLGKYRRVKGIESCLILKEYLRKNPYAVVYFRNPGRIDLWVISLLKLLHNQGSKILYEIPTFPYDMELTSNFRARIDLLIDKLFRNRIKKYVDRVVTFSKDEKIYGVQTIRTMNGIRVDSIMPIQSTQTHPEINLLALGTFQKSHGYERCIRALANYYDTGGSQQVILHMVGEGDELESYKQLVKGLKIDEKVVFYGRKSGDELDAIYEKMDLALGCFGLYKRRLNRISAIKTREYLAKGLPIVTGCKEDIFENCKQNIFIEFPNDNSDIDMKIIIDFYNEIYRDKNKSIVHQAIHAFAKENLDYMIVMKPVIEYILK